MRIAIVGGGISGLTAAHLLSREHEVQVFEAARHLGGHTYTVEVEEAGQTLPVDMGFIVYNRRNYPNFVRLLDELGVGTAESEMSFSVRCEQTGLEWNGSSLNQIFAQRSNFLRPSFYGMLLEILRFHREAPKLLAGDENPTFGEFLARHGFRGRVVDHYLIPMTAAIWSTDRQRMFEYPARTLFTFLRNHGMLQVEDRPQWRYLTGGSKSYVEVLRRPLEDRIHLGARIERITRREGAVEVKPQGQVAHRFDRVVIAAHSDQALALLSDPTQEERQVLGAIAYQDSDVVLHTDERFLPRRRRARASWNYHLGVEGEGVQMTYYMNRLQKLDTEKHYCVTLNRTAEIDPAKILDRQSMAHPLYTQEAIDAQGRWDEISRDETFFCGAYWGYGFHEDGVKSALQVVEKLGVSW